ncbi:MAG: aminotransferase class I/II-fold pyridoxal phosphate-dependent enzyme [Lysobacterales bacterium]
MTELPAPWADELALRQQAIRQSNRWRQRRPVDDKLQDFASNDYLGLGKAPEISSALADVLANSARRWGVGAGSAQLLGGYHQIHKELESAIAQWVRRPAAALFSTGYMANLGLISALAQRGDLVVQDKMNHASLIDAAQLSQARLVRFRHNDVEAANRQLALAAKRRMLVVESLFSMDGDLAPLAALSELAQTHDALLCVDEAHSLGVLGDDGAGACAAEQIDASAAPIIVGTFGKSLGTFGAFVAGPQLVVDTLVNQARSHIYTTALPPALAAVTLDNLRRVQEDHWRRDHLQTLITKFRQRAGTLGLPLGDSQSPIQPIILGSSENALRVSQTLFRQGFHVPAIRPPTVPANSARLRVSLNAAHQVSDLEPLLLAIAGAIDAA